MPVKLLRELLHAVTLVRRHLQQRITQLAVNAEHGVKCHSVLLINQVGFIQQ